jgi:membrane-anchored protein YejM (alkaline phosphatase superfamily)
MTEKDGAKLFNRYKNANYFNDSLIHNMVNALKKKGLYENSIIIVTSDHGEEFYEFGTYGHNNAFNRKQAQVPFIVHWPKGGHKDIQMMTSHLDMVPTLLKYIGVSTAPEKYSMGKDLLDTNYKHDYVFVGNWNNNAMVTDKYTYVFNNVNFFENKVHSTETYKIVEEPANGEQQKIIVQVLEQNSRFIN